MHSFSKFVIDEKAILENFNEVDSYACGTIAMIKADGYGLGAEEIFKILSSRASGFGVACLSEALKLRAIHNEAMILIVGVVSDYRKAIDNDISICVQSMEDFYRLKHALKMTKKKAKVHIKFNSGMNRLGVNRKEFLNLLIDIFREKNVILEGVFTHFCTADCDEMFLCKQAEEFKRILKLLPSGVNPIIHFGGGGINKRQIEKLGLKNYALRSGIKLVNGKKCALSIKSKIVKVLELKKGDRLGYSNGYIAEKAVKVGVVPLGYADGILRGLSDKVYVKVKGRKCKIIGNICMDMFFVDLGNLNVKTFEEVLVFDSPKEWAKALNTIDYEIFTSFNAKRMNKVVKKYNSCDII